MASAVEGRFLEIEGVRSVTRRTGRAERDEHAEPVSNSEIDVTIETVGGTADTLTESVNVTRPGGRIVVLGVFEGSPPIPGLGFMGKEPTMVGSNCYARDGRVGDFGLATEQVVRHASAISELVTHRFALDQVVEAFAAASDKKAGAIKVHLMP